MQDGKSTTTPLIKELISPGTPYRALCRLYTVTSIESLGSGLAVCRVVHPGTAGSCGQGGDTLADLAGGY